MLAWSDDQIATSWIAQALIESSALKVTRVVPAGIGVQKLMNAPSLTPSTPSPFCICSWAGKNAPPFAEIWIEPRFAWPENRRKELAGAAPAKFTVGLVLACTPLIAMSPRSIVKGIAGDIEKLDQCHVFPAPAPVMTEHPGMLHIVPSSGA
jgi:hypothetical protein